MLYEFVPDDGEAVIISGEVLGLGRVRPRRQECELARRKGPHFHAICGGRHGVTWLVTGSPTSFAVWDFRGDNGVLRRVRDTDIEVFQNWGDSHALNVWENRLRENARKLKRRRAFCRGSGPDPSEQSSEKKGED